MKFLLLCWQVIHGAYLNFNKHQGSLFSKSLAFQTLFCFIPGIATILFLAGYINLLDQPIFKIKEILSEQFIPRVVQKNITIQLDLALIQAKGASLFAMSIFIASLYGLLSGLKEIFYCFAEESKHGLLKQQIIGFVLFIAILTCFTIGIAIVSFLIAIPEIHLNYPVILLKALNSLLLTMMIFTLYTISSPININKWVSVIFSFFIGIVLFFAQKMFVIYVMWFPAYMFVYGAIAFLPLLFFWLYIYWIIFLYGYNLLIMIHRIEIQRKTDKILKRL